MNDLLYQTKCLILVQKDSREQSFFLDKVLHALQHALWGVLLRRVSLCLSCWRCHALRHALGGMSPRRAALCIWHPCVPRLEARPVRRVPEAWDSLPQFSRWATPWDTPCEACLWGVQLTDFIFLVWPRLVTCFTRRVSPYSHPNASQMLTIIYQTFPIHHASFIYQNALYFKHTTQYLHGLQTPLQFAKYCRFNYMPTL